MMKNAYWFVAVVLAMSFSSPTVYAQIGNFGIVKLHGFPSPNPIPPTIEFGSTAQFGTISGSLNGIKFDSAQNPGAFQIQHDAPSSGLAVGHDGVGIGTVIQLATLHVMASSNEFSAYDEARLLIENELFDTSLRTMFELVNNGPARFEITNTNSNQTWAFQTNNSDAFLVNRLGSGGNEFSIRKNGMVTMGPGGQLNFVLHPNGNLDINGTLNQLSDRNSKENFREVNPEDILDRVVQLPITTWNYKDDVDTVRHMGPMAQDFHAAFGLGQNNTSIASVDTTGVAFAAIQTLAHTNRRLQEDSRQLDSQLADLQERLYRLEATTRQPRP